MKIMMIITKLLLIPTAANAGGVRKFVVSLNTVRSESPCALKLRCVDLVFVLGICTDARGHHFQQLL
jgi:hypothetical protein